MDVSRLILVLNGRPQIPLSFSCPSDTCGVDEGPRNKRIRQDTCCVHRCRLRGGLHGTLVATASRVLLLVDDGGGHREAAHRLVALHAPGFCLCLHGAAAGMGGAPTDMGGATTADTGGAIRRGTDDTRTSMLAAVPAWSNSPLLVELNWSGELLNHAPPWGGNWLRRAKRGW